MCTREIGNRALFAATYATAFYFWHFNRSNFWSRLIILHGVSHARFNQKFPPTRTALSTQALRKAKVVDVYDNRSASCREPPLSSPFPKNSKISISPSSRSLDSLSNLHLDSLIGRRCSSRNDSSSFPAKRSLACSAFPCNGQFILTL